jgi:hypothetical protein
MPGKKEEIDFHSAYRAYNKRMAGLSRNEPNEYKRLYNELHASYVDKFSGQYGGPRWGEDLFFGVLYEQIRWASYLHRLQPKEFVKSLFDGYTGAKDFVIRLQGVAPQSV